MGTLAKHSEIRVPWAFTALICAFLICFTAGERISIMLPIAMLLGAGMMGLVLRRWTKEGVRIPLEIGLLCLFIVWAVISGYALVVDGAAFEVGVKRMIQVILVAGC